jgi:hypothetical protein
VALAARAQSDVQWLYHVCARDLSADANAFCLTYTSAVADLMRMNCEIAKQRLSTGGLSNADDRRAMLSVASDATAIYGLARAKFAFIDWANANPKRWNLPMAGRCHGGPSRKMAMRVSVSDAPRYSLKCKPAQRCSKKAPRIGDARAGEGGGICSYTQT